MPGFDRTGPEGKGSQTGIGQGRCRTGKSDFSDKEHATDFMPQQKVGKHLRRRLRVSQDSEQDFEGCKGAGRNKRRGRSL